MPLNRDLHQVYGNGRFGAKVIDTVPTVQVIVARIISLRVRTTWSMSSLSACSVMSATSAAIVGPPYLSKRMYRPGAKLIWKLWGSRGRERLGE